MTRVARSLRRAPKPEEDPAACMARYLDGLAPDEAAVLDELARRDREVGPPVSTLDPDDDDAP